MDLEAQLAAWMQGEVVVVGIGNPLRGDDAAGSMVASRIEALPSVSVIDAEDVPENYVAAVVNRRPDTIVLIDSVDSDSAPGSVVLLSRDQLAGYCPSTHRVPVSLLMRLFERETHARVVLIGIQPAHTRFLEPMSEAAETAAGQIAGALNRALAGRRPPARRVAAGSFKGEMSA
jgi:hydrogenase 3 maturation protease